MRVVFRGTARPAALILIGALALGAAGCGPAKAATQAAGDEGGIGAAPTPDPTSSQLAQNASSANTANPANGGGNRGGNGGDGTGDRHDPRPSGSASPKASTSAKAAPVIVYFRVQQQPKCKGSSGQGPIIPLILEWEVTGADAVTLSSDGTTKSYPVKGTETYVYGCAGAAGSTDRHTYTLKAQHDGASVTRSLSASAVVN